MEAKRDAAGGGYRSSQPPKKARPDFMDDDEEYDEAMIQNLEALERDGSASGAEVFSRWGRKPMAAVNPAADNVAFQQLEIDYYFGQTHAGVPGRKPQKVSSAAIVRVFGLTDAGNSVTVHVHGFQPYFYCDIPPGCDHDTAFCEKFKKQLEEEIKQTEKNAEVCVSDVCIEQKMNIMYYRGGQMMDVFKITMTLPNLVPKARNIIKRAQLSTYEGNVIFPLRFMVDCDIVGGNWMEVTKGSYRMRPAGSSFAVGGRATSAQFECDVWYDRLESHKPEGEWSRIAPFRILSFDIECQGRKGCFPDAKHDPVIQIASYITEQGQKKPLLRTVVTLNSCAPIIGSLVREFEDEKGLLMDFRALVEAVDPDIVIGYNINNFDIPYLLDRAEALGVSNFPFLGRVLGSRTRMKNATFSSKAFGTRESKQITMEGRFIFDIMQVMQRDFKLPSYSLNNVSAHFLGDQKEDVHHSIISELQMGNAETRRRLAVYCLKDAFLPQRLLDKLMLVYNYVEMARVTGVPITFLLSRGQQIKVISQLLRKTRTKDMLLPNQERQATDDTYEGATVIEPKRGYYEVPIATLDFASLYPSIMQAHNLCYSTLVRKGDLSKLQPDQYQLTPNGDAFVKPSVCEGILPEILTELLSARKRAKADLKKATDPLERAVLDGRQLALKVSANSVYGFTGATVGQLPCFQISAGVTAYGRQMIEHTKTMVEKEYTIANGYEHDAIVVYGDTDSVMVKFGVLDVAKSMELGYEAADKVTKTFLTPIKLEFEKVYYPYLLINKKRYAGMYWTNPDKYDKMDCKGIETVRRDNCSLVKDVLNTVLDRILKERDVEGAKTYVRESIAELLQGRVDLSLLVITKQYVKAAEDYKGGKQAHIELAGRMRKRDAATAPNIGDRVPYVMTKQHAKAKGFEKSEDPIYVLENNIPIDTQWYLEHQLMEPIKRIFDPVMRNVSELFAGDHTRHVAVSTVSKNVGIMKFAVKKLSCMSCKAPITAGSLCQYCESREGEICMNKLRELQAYEQTFARLWTQCQRCQGSLHTDVLCTSADCPIFYRRKKVQKDLAQVQEELQRFSW